MAEGITLLASKQVCIMQPCQTRPAPAETVPDWMNFRLASRVMDFALGVYGWPYYICTTNCCCGSDRLCTLMRRLRCCYTCRCDRVLIIKDNCCLCNTTALLLQTAIDETDLFYVSFHDEVWKAPFVACIDHSSRNIIVAIRGSIEDSLQFPYEWCGGSAVSDKAEAGDTGGSETGASQDVSRYFVHKGFLRTARYIYTKLKDEHILEDLFVLQPDYDLVITGHSLGAGVASVVSMLLRPLYPKVMCFAFSPPGCVVSENAVPYTREFVFSIICGDDLVPRLSVSSLQALKMSVLDALEQTSRPKYEILFKGCFRYFIESKSNIEPVVDEEAAVHIQQQSPTDPLILQGGGRRTLTYTDEQLKSSFEIVRSTKLQCPGRILHVTREKGDGDEPVYLSTWCDQSRFEGIKLSGSMINDHMPYFVSDVLKSLATIPCKFSSA
ncbi:unnamed protein product [Soboliphyme baturini]|uniref:sn-1-specific diacylglycerol lipase n=1 Tax=Soboliphyme baturini TaxID=241478 RepID=A0A183IE66_9BILA|nr:unnamed protein product [Soboliphyme baturini]